jgi:hypothetical protein
MLEEGGEGGRPGGREGGGKRVRDREASQGEKDGKQLRREMEGKGDF